MVYRVPLAWDEPKNNKDNRDPWGNNNSNEGPPDLDQIFRKFQDKFKGGMNGGGSGSGSDSGGGMLGFPKGSNIAFGLLAIVLFGFYVASGFYVVQPQEQAVVRRFGKYQRTVGKGPHWYPKFIESVDVVNTESVTSTRISGTMLTKDENLVTVEVQVQYRISNIENYLFKIADPKRSLEQTAESALRQAVGENNLDFIITSGRDVVAKAVEEQLSTSMNYYSSGIFVSSVVYKEGKAPDQVKEAFDDATRAREDKERFIHESEAYSNSIRAEVKGQVDRIIKEAESYKSETVNFALGDASKFNLVLPEYKKSPKITRTRLYLDTMENVLGNSSKVLIDNNSSNNLLYLPLDKIINSGNKKVVKFEAPELSKVVANNSNDSSRVAEEVTSYPRGRRGRG